MKIAVGQLTTGASLDENLTHCVALLHEAHRQGVKAVFLPEAADFIVPKGQQPAVSATCPSSAAFVDAITQLALELELIVAVGVHETSAIDGKRYNALQVVGRNISATYRKIHLFDVDLAPEGPTLYESHDIQGGDMPVVVDLGDGVRLGLAICYDVRFPELAKALVDAGANVLAFPSAFTVPTGRAHWGTALKVIDRLEILMRSRAIECQSYVVSPAQIGQHYQGRCSWGQSMIVDPWGTIVAQLPSIDTHASAKSPWSLTTADIDLKQIQEARRRIPLARSRATRLWNPQQ